MNLLMISSSAVDKDLLYATGFLSSDPFIFFQCGKRRELYVSDMEVPRAKKEAKKGIVVKSNSVLMQKVVRAGHTPNLIHAALVVLKSSRIKRLTIPRNFPWVWADILRKNGVCIIKKIPLFPERIIKSKSEIKEVTRVQRATEKAMAAAIELIRGSEPRGSYLYYGDKKLTSEDVKLKIRMTLSAHSCLDEETIVSCGSQSIVPHISGSGPLRVSKPIIIDIFPHSEKSHYFADMTRTVCKGPVPEKLKTLYALVKEAQDVALRSVKDGVGGDYVHQQVVDFFKSKDVGRYFIHGTGHGVGLDVHESPRVAHSGAMLKEGMVITLEPGLYQKGVGGVRLEDMVVVTKKGCRNLTRFPKVLMV